MSDKGIKKSLGLSMLGGIYQHRTQQNTLVFHDYAGDPDLRVCLEVTTCNIFVDNLHKLLR